ncbi:CFA52 protein, partial [Rhinopomastus cyanomelas]|nr:CFA52 protein [Rhinopomastus cyanomelas]
AVGGLELLAAIGYNGHVPCGLICHPDMEHVLYPLGCTVIIQELDSKKQTFLHGHTNNVSCVAVSRNGKYIASGQVTFMGFKANIILWDFQKKQSLAQLSLHKGRITGLAFSPNSLYLVSLGGQDDGSVVVWHVAENKAICGSPASARSAGNATVVAYSSSRDEVFVTAGKETIRVWQLDLANRKIYPTECQTGHLRRVITCLRVADDDSCFYVGTSSGDILKMSLNHKVLMNYGPQKKKFSSGVTALLVLKTGDLVVGTGSGIVALCKSSNYEAMKKIQVHGAITSLTHRGQGQLFFVGTNECYMYGVNCAAFKEELIATCHSEAVNDIIFPLRASDLFVTCSKNDIRVWHTPESRELLRIVVPNVTCHAIDLMGDGTSIISAWDDGKIRAFLPESGQLLFTINHAHSLGVTAIAAMSNRKCIISGGGEGQVRIWEIGEKTQKLGEVLKEHVSAVSCIKMKKNEQECVTASLDGTCIIWDIVHFVRRQMILANTMFKCVCYHPEEYQLITGGTDRQIGYWEVFDGSAVREVEGSASGSINGMDITSDGSCFVTGGDDHLVKLWDYNEGAVIHTGVGHGSNITRLKICPEKKYIVSVSTDGAILLWKYP